MLTDMDMFLTGVLGGALSSGAIIGVMYVHFHGVFSDYFYNKDLFVMQQNIKRLLAEVEALKEQIKHINLDHYETIVEEEFK